ncbi:LutB/LldF family L-lactate oxidation iron-sulfur protein [Rothia kristinae]|uniref:LutB/LldF family L-lactate oxidation iron-sulfur protein n=1 Tax=Rothia kristinae TaxID=37923 RepID=UPI0011A76B8D|nr:LutB/LldF family L-lactate oxidation iron-sulfur protein [Rothia kristinae]
MTVTQLGMPTVPPHGQGNIFAYESFTRHAARALHDETMRGNLNFALSKIRTKRATVVSEMPDWQHLRTAGSEIKQNVLARLPELLEQFEENFTARGGHVHWARDAEEANRIALDLIREQGVTEVSKIKSMATQETGLNEYLEAHGIEAVETDLAEEIVQLGHDKPSHIVVPAIHRNRSEIRDIFKKEIPGVRQDLSDDPAELAEASRKRLRRKFFENKVAVSGTNFGVAESGTLTIVESEGNGRMCLTLPETLITFMGIEKVIPRFEDLEVFLQLLPRSSTGERMNPYTSLWTGVTPGDGPQNMHVILIDNGRTAVLKDEMGRQALHCIRCSACLNVCPVYQRAGGHSYGSVYPGPIGAILSPQLGGIEAEANNSLPYASSLCGACYEVCPVKINIPDVLVHLRGKDIDAQHGKGEEGTKRGMPTQMDGMMAGARVAFGSGKVLGLAEKALLPAGRVVAGKDHRIDKLPGLVGGWTKYRDIDTPPKESFRSWWKKNRGKAPAPRPASERVDVEELIRANRGKAEALHEQQAKRYAKDQDDYTRLMASERVGIQRAQAAGETVADYARGTEEDYEA